ncbi:hypothetical protein CK203_013730 [Vitis vinifera]|uniref:Uncharacterized protein n=1 Tax=Vitis vinifera TaxID=29760 RepID=A0A438JJP1_VITVI|nr:hypothetical protein CK203_024138 [Vitis vinifera]RVX09170.1 hypothetical protein CK203_013730 [Vitis vinifera]
MERRIPFGILFSPSISIFSGETNCIALRAVSHNYPNIMVACWEQVSTIVYGFLRATPEVPARQWKGHSGNTVGSIGEKTLTAAIKARDPNAFFISTGVPIVSFSLLNLCSSYDVNFLQSSYKRDPNALQLSNTSITVSGNTH